MDQKFIRFKEEGESLRIAEGEKLSIDITLTELVRDSSNTG